MQVETVAAEAAAPPIAAVETTPAPVAEAPAAPETPEARDAVITDELSAVWDKQFTNGVDRGEKGRFVPKNPAEAEQSPGPAEAEAKPATDKPADPAIKPIDPPA